MGKPKRKHQDLMRISSVLGVDGFDHIFEIEDNQVKWDFNLSRLPYFIAGRKKADRFRDLMLIETIEQNGQSIEVQWEVRHDRYLGLPSSFDRDVWIGILQIVNEQTDNGKKPVPDVVFLGSSYSFLNRIGKPSDGRYIQMLRESLERLATTGCITKGAFNCPKSGGYLHLGEVFHLIRSWGFKGDPKTGGGVHESNFVILDPIIKQNLDSFYVSLLRADYLKSLKGDIAKLLYPLLSYRFWRASQRKESYWRVHWSELIAYIALKVDSLKRAKDRLKSALLELKRRQYISDDSDWDGQYFLFYPGVEYVREHQEKVLAKDNFKKKKIQSKQSPSSIPAVKPVWHGTQNYPYTKEEEIGYQLCRLKTGRPLNFKRLEKEGIDPQEVYKALAALEESKNEA